MIAAALVSWLLTYLIHSTILLLIALVIAWRFSEQHAWLDMVWKTALIGPFVTATLQPNFAAAPVGGQWSIAPTPVVEEKFEAEPTIDRSSASSIQRVEKARPVARPMLRISWPTMIVMTWLCVAVIAVLRYLARLRRVYRTLATATRINADVPGSIRVRVSDNCRVPLALAGRQIVVPGRLFDLDPEQQRAALAHEMAHVVRRDPEWLIAIEFITRAFFFQPLHRVARARLYDSAEFLCDQWAVGHTQSPLALARCLSEVATWSDSDQMVEGASTAVRNIARNDSAIVRRVNRILNGATDPSWRPRIWWMAVPVALVAVAAPRVSATTVAAAAVTVREAVVADREPAKKAEEQLPRRDRAWTPSQVAAARNELQVIRATGGTLDERWRWALGEAQRRRVSDFWLVYMFTTPTHADDFVMSDSLKGSLVSSDGTVSSSGPHLSMLDGTVALEGGKIAVLLHYRGGTIDRAGYRSAGLGFDFGRTPVFWLGHAAEAQSFARVRDLFAQVKGERLQTMMIDLASMHSDSNVVIPFLTSLVAPSQPAVIRAEAAEGFEHHPDPRSVEVLLRLARTDTDSHVRAEAAETIGEVQTPESIPALTELAEHSPDPAVRHEAAEAFGEQPAARAVPAIERLLSASGDEEVLNEAIEALGDLHDDARAMAVLERLAREDTREAVQVEALETLTESSEDSIHPVVLELAVSGATASLRRNAIEEIGDAASNLGGQALDAAFRAITHAIFDDPDSSVRMEGLDVLEDMPGTRALEVLRDVVARHPDASVKREAEKQLRERRR